MENIFLKLKVTWSFIVDIQMYLELKRCEIQYPRNVNLSFKNLFLFSGKFIKRPSQNLGYVQVGF